MRVTNGMIRNTTLNGLYNNMNTLNKTYAQMTTGKKIQTVSDDPIIAGRALKLTTSVLENAQYQSNTKEALSWMEITEGALKNMNEILTTIRTKCVQGADGTLKDDDKAKVKTQIEELWGQLQEEANVTYAGRYVFSGYKTDKPLMKNDGVNPEVDGKIKNQHIDYEIGVNSTITVNTEGMDVTMNAIKKCVDALKNFDNLSESQLHDKFNDALKQIDDIMSDISEKTADLGSKMSRLDYTKLRLSDQNVAYSNLLSETQDVDIEEVYTNFNAQYATYQSALQATAKIIKNTLADYL